MASMNRKLNNMYMHYDVTKASRLPAASIENLEQPRRPCFDLKAVNHPANSSGLQ